MIPKELKEIASQWYEILTKTPEDMDETFVTKNNITLSLSNPMTCVVGEAYGFNDYYDDPDEHEYCHDCHKYSMDIYNHYGDIATPIKKFVKHFKEKHNKK